MNSFYKNFYRYLKLFCMQKNLLDINEIIIPEGVLTKIYSLFKFYTISLNIDDQIDKYIDYPNSINQTKNNHETYIQNIFKNLTFFTYYFTDISNNHQNKYENNVITQFINVVICYEDECIIIKNIHKLLIQKIINNLKEQKIAMLNVNHNMKSANENEKNAKEEIKQFCSYFLMQIESDHFITLTINSIIGYLIRRYFYPTYFFKNPSFFEFDSKVKTSEKDLYLSLMKALSAENQIEMIYDLINFLNDYAKINNTSNKIQVRKFHKDEFIELSSFSKGNNIFSLVMHIESLYIFLLKNISLNNNTDKENYFCEHFSNRYFTKFYGFVIEEEDEIIGYIYEYMCNGTLSKYLTSNKDNNDEIFTLISMIRISQGMKYLNASSFIHRDLKPENILLDHDYLPYISDFDQIKLLNNANSSNNFTNDIGSILYSSPEQDNGEKLSFQTDIFSFGLIIYFLYEKENLLNGKKYLCGNEKNSIQIPLKAQIPKNIQDLIMGCIQFDPEKRIKNENIEKTIIDEVNSFLYIEKFLAKDIMDLRETNIIQFFFECFLLEHSNKNKLHEFFENIYCFNLLFTEKKLKGNSFLFLKLGNYHKKGFRVEKNYSIALEYFTLSAKLKNSDAINNIGSFYYYGKGVEQDFKKAKKYFELSAEYNNLCAFMNLGILYYEGNGVKKDYIIAEKYFKKYAQSSNSDIYVQLGSHYFNGDTFKKDIKKGFEYFELAGKLNNSEALFLLGCRYLIGKDCIKDVSKAINYFELSAKLLNPMALSNLGLFYLEGKIVKKDLAKSKEYLEKAVIFNIPSAYNNLGMLYYEYGNYQEAKKCYDLAADFKIPKAFFNIGNLYMQGKGFEKNYEKAIDYYEKAAELNDIEALYYLGTNYANGVIIEKNSRKALEYLERSALYGNSDAYCYLGYIYLMGEIVKKDPKKALRYYENAANLNNSDALLVLGSHYQTGRYVEQSYEKAIEYFQKAADLNNSYALFNLAAFYASGIGTDKNIDKAIEYYTKAATLNNDDAINVLGYLYENGIGFVKDIPKAISLYEKAIKLNNNGFSLFNLGNLYYEGKDVQKNYSKAIYYFEQSAKQHNSDALLYLGIIYADGKGVDQDLSKAKNYFEKATNYNNPDAYSFLGTLYENGIGVETNYFKAKKYYELASQLECPNAFFHLGRFYSNGEFFDIDITKSISYFLKCINTKNTQITNNIIPYTQSFFFSIINEFRYHSYNEVGLIYLIFCDDIDKSIHYIKEAAFAEYPYGQNNYGILFQFYLNNISNAKHMYERSSEHNFSLAEFNLGYIYEKENKINESINYYKKASKHYDLPIIFRNNQYNDKRLILSKKYIICLSNLKIVDYYLKKQNYKKARKYFIKLLSEIILVYKKANIKQFSLINIKILILGFPLFCPIIQSDIFESIITNTELYVDNYQNAGELFDFLISDSNKILFFKNDICDTIKIMEKILYTPPYQILFGKFDLNKKIIKKNTNDKRENVSNKFFEGFGDLT